MNQKNLDRLKINGLKFLFPIQEQRGEHNCVHLFKIRHLHLHNTLDEYYADCKGNQGFLGPGKNFHNVYCAYTLRKTCLCRSFHSGRMFDARYLILQRLHLCKLVGLLRPFLLSRPGKHPGRQILLLV